MTQCVTERVVCKPQEKKGTGLFPFYRVQLMSPFVLHQTLLCKDEYCMGISLMCREVIFPGVQDRL